ncbi:EAL domain-containing protein [Stappia sp. F7233]|uniref:EAL domain-containing protein n=1 Tax=Stappia albiluteola TaxID=2758565 RepID=A0A839ADN7_9HYPH|nr:EAL domain-containing protein [Stappia albiluteola]MBA5777793.1 EAL domain-containing protein [Stappia albiluteola]
MTLWKQAIGTKRGRGFVLGFVFIACTLSTVLAAVFISTEYLRADLRRQNDDLLGIYDRATDSALAILDRLKAEVGGPPCGRSFQEGLNRVAFMPDKINAIAFGAGDRIECATVPGALQDSARLGEPDIAASENSYKADFWLGRNQSLLGFPDMIGTLIRRDGFIVIVPETEAADIPPARYEYEVVFKGDGKVLHRSGRPALYRELSASGELGLRFEDLTLAIAVCGRSDFHCVISRTSIADAVEKSPLAGFAIAGLALIVGYLGRRKGARTIERYCSFENRFLRGFHAGHVTCLLQPILSAGGTRIVGAEALARWRDADGTLVTPERFLPIVRRRGEGRKLTKLVVENARAAILETLVFSGDFRLSINVSPHDYRYDFLYPLLGDPLELKGGGTLTYAVEIVETEGVDIPGISREMLALRAKGIETYIDDFGVGYANIGNLAALPLDGVKLDRSFAMANEASLLGRMLPNALELVVSAGHKVIVEGVETKRRFDTLCSSPKVDSMQGYFIGRPMTADQLAAFVKTGLPAEPMLARGPRDGNRPIAGRQVPQPGAADELHADP